MIAAPPSSTFGARATAVTGLTGTIGAQIIDTPSGTVVLARATVGIVEAPVGTYTATLTSPATAGKYQVVIDTGGPTPAYTREDLIVTAMVPTVADVAALLRARTRDSEGVEVGTFNADTSPTGEAAQAMIAQAVGAVSARVGPDIPDDMLPNAQRLAALMAAMLIEMSYYPEQVESGRSAYDQYKELYDDGMTTLLAAIVGDPEEAGFGRGIISNPTTRVDGYSSDIPFDEVYAVGAAGRVRRGYYNDDVPD